MLPTRLTELGAVVSIKCWTAEDIIPALLDSDLATFLWAEDYVQHPDAFAEFLNQAEVAVQAYAGVAGKVAPRMLNNIPFVRWNMDKKYLLDIKDAGFAIPQTEILDTKAFSSVEALHSRLQLFQQSGSIILKPSISASSGNTHLIAEVSALSLNDLAYLDWCIKGSLTSSLVIQQFEPAIALGEYSFIFIAGILTHVILKSPTEGEFRCQPAFGGRLSHVPIGEIKETLLSTANKILKTLTSWFGEIGYVRVDGLLPDDGRGFVLMEIEAIEPELYLRFGGLQEMLSLLLARG
ncbi:ATP-grasp domain-containing protein [Aspergillus undulatus]|uniref:ATP-grasp domain-containing protein n=1 Tax=Aspergillus undulatus TaxID=1810928 RepID=UPI003CCCB540